MKENQGLLHRSLTLIGAVKRRLCYLSVWICLVIPLLMNSSAAMAQNAPPILISDSASAPLPDNWGTLIVVTTNLGEVKAYADNTLLYSANNPLMATATGAGLYNNSAGLGLTNRWDNFAVLNAP